MHGKLTNHVEMVLQIERYSLYSQIVLYKARPRSNLAPFAQNQIAALNSRTYVYVSPSSVQNW
jgi:hypothetical protein